MARIEQQGEQLRLVEKLKSEEPTVIEDLIRDIQKSRGCASYIIVTHQDSTIRRTADRVIFLHRGKIQWNGSVTEIDETDNPFVRQFFSGDVEGPIQMVQ